MKIVTKLIVSIRNILLIILVLIFAFMVICHMLRQFEQYKISQIFSENRIVFEEIVEGEGETAYVVNTEKHLIITSTLQELGIGDIFLWKDNCFFEHSNKALLLFPQGIAYVCKLESIPDWIILSPISDDWYYYRIVS